jgi:glutathione S-transferase
MFMTSRQPTLILCELTDPGIEGVESYSPFCLKIHRALRAAGLTYERRFAHDPGEFKHWNPTGQVPVLLIDGEPVSDSTRILKRIDAIRGSFTRALSERQRAEAWLWEELADSSLNGFLVSARWADERNWPVVCEAYFGAAPWFVRRLIVPKLRKKVIAALVARDVWRQGGEACWQRFLAQLDQLETCAPECGFWLSQSLSVADLGLFGQLHGLRTPLTRAHAEELARRTRLSAYLDRVDAATRSQPLAADDVGLSARAGSCAVGEFGDGLAVARASALTRAIG